MRGGTKILNRDLKKYTTSPGRGRKILISVFTLILGVLAGSVVTELLLRALWPASGKYYIWQPRMSVTYHPAAGIVHGVASVAHFRVNSEGMLGEEMREPKQNEYRILTIGGSTTQCIMLDQAKTWPTVLEQRLGHTADGRQVRIGNLGRAGFNSRDHIGAMRFVVGQYNADAVVVLVGANDMVERLVQGDAYDPHFVEDQARYDQWVVSRFAVAPPSAHVSPFYRRTAVWRLSRWFRSLFFDTRQLRMDNQGQWLADARLYRRKAVLHDRIPPLASGLDEYERNLRVIVQEARKRSMRIVLITQPTFWKDTMTAAEDKLLWMGFAPGPSGRKLEWPWWKDGGDAYLYTSPALKSAMDSYNRRLLRTCAQLGVEYFDMASQLPQTAEVYFDDMHYTDAGARQFADRLAAHIKTTAPFAADHKSAAPFAARQAHAPGGF